MELKPIWTAAVPSFGSRPAAPALPARQPGAAASAGRQTARAALALFATEAGRRLRHCRRLRRAAARRAGGDSSEGVPPLEPSLPSDGGLAVWRSRQPSNKKTVPVILFPLSDLLLLGHTKRMHLFEDRWVDMIDTARRDHNGVIALIYFASNGSVMDVATVAEITACGNFGNAGRMVTVRGVSRARLRELSTAVATFDEWGTGLVEELPEFTNEDLQPRSEDGVQNEAEVAASELGSLLQDLNLSKPGDDAAQGSVEEVPRKEADSPKLWTHERTAIGEDFASLANTAWSECLTTVQRTLAGVPLVPPKSAGDDFKFPVFDPPVLVPGGPQAEVATLYAALQAAGLETRLRLFLGHSESLSERIRMLTKKIREQDGMARARRALAGVFKDDAAS